MWSSTIDILNPYDAVTVSREDKEPTKEET